jgi:hypothetical protein
MPAEFEAGLATARTLAATRPLDERGRELVGILEADPARR